MTDDELDAQLGSWEMTVGSITDNVMSLVEASALPSQEQLLADLLSEVRALRLNMQQLRAEVATLRGEITQSAEKPTVPSAKIPGYPLLPFASSEETLPFFH